MPPNLDDLAPVIGRLPDAAPPVGAAPADLDAQAPIIGRVDAGAGAPMISAPFIQPRVPIAPAQILARAQAAAAPAQAGLGPAAPASPNGGVLGLNMRTQTPGKLLGDAIPNDNGEATFRGPDGKLQLADESKHMLQVDPATGKLQVFEKTEGSRPATSGDVGKLGYAITKALPVIGPAIALPEMAGGALAGKVSPENMASELSGLAITGTMAAPKGAFGSGPAGMVQHLEEEHMALPPAERPEVAGAPGETPPGAPGETAGGPPGAPPPTGGEAPPPPPPGGERGAAMVRALSPEARDSLKAAVDRQEITPDNLADKTADLAPAQMLGELGPSLTADMGALASVPGAAKNTITTELGARAAQTPQRLDALLTDTFGAPRAPGEIVRQLKQGQAQAAKPLYDAWNQTIVPPTPALEALRPRLEAAGAVRDAEKALAVEGQPSSITFAPSRPGGALLKTHTLSSADLGLPGSDLTLRQQSGPTARAYDLMKQSLDDRIQAALANKQNGVARRFGELKDELVSAIDNHPDPRVAGIWKQGREAFQAPEKVIDAIKTGNTFFDPRLSLDELETKFAGATAHQMEGLRTGLRAAAGHFLEGSVRGDANLRGKVSSLEARRKIEWAIGKDAAARFESAIEAESKIAKSPNAVIGGSPTQPRQEAARNWTVQPSKFSETIGQLLEEKAGGPLVGMAAHLAGFEPTTALALGAGTAMVQKIRNAAAERAMAAVRDQVAPVMTLKGADAKGALHELLHGSPEGGGAGAAPVKGPQTGKSAAAAPGAPAQPANAMRRASSGETGLAPTNSSGVTAPAASAQPLPGVQSSIRPAPEGSSTTRAMAPSIFEGPVTTLAAGGRFPASAVRIGDIDQASNKRILHASNDTLALRQAAEENKPRFEAGLARLTDGIPGSSVYGVRVKDLPGLQQKIESKGRPASTISDFLGGRIVVDTPDALNAVLDRLHDSGTIVESENFIPTAKEGYRAYHAQLDLGDGTSAELQIVPKPIADVMNTSHAIRQPVKRLDITQPEQMAQFKQTMAAAQKVTDDAWHASPAWQDYAAGIKQKGNLLGEKVPNMPPHRVVGADGNGIDVAPIVMEADQVKTSADAGYDPSLQPRQRDRAASQAQIREIAGTLDPQRLGYSAEADRGAPIVGPDGVVESGNGRVMALRQAYGQNGPAAERYRSWLAGQGVDTARFKAPVLVRQRTTDLTPQQHQQFTVAANQATTLALSGGERALADARMLSLAALDLIRQPEDLGANANRDFARAFMAKLPASERGSLVNAEGGLSAEGLSRMRNAVLAKAYGDSHILTRIAESTDDEVKSISNALTASAPAWAKLKAGIDAGAIDREVDVTPQLVEAVGKTADLRARGQKLDNYLSQSDAFSRLDNQVEAFMRLFYDPKGRRAAGAPAITRALQLYAQEAAKVAADKGLDLGLAPVKSGDILKMVAARSNDNEAQQAGLFGTGGAGHR